MSDADEIRAVAARVSTIAADLRATSIRVRSGDGVQWYSVGAQQYRTRLSTTAARISDLARKVDALAADLRRYARSVERRQNAVTDPISTGVSMVKELL